MSDQIYAFVAIRFDYARMEVLGGATTERKARELAEMAAGGTLVWRDHPYGYGSQCRSIADARPRIQKGAWYLVYEVKLEEDNGLSGRPKRTGRQAKPRARSVVPPVRP